MRNRGRTIDAGDYSHVVASGYSPARTGVALKKAHLFGWIKIDRPGIDAELVVPPEIFQEQIVAVDVFARQDVA